MKIEEFIEHLKEIKKDFPGINVNIQDWRKNLGDDHGDGSSEGIYPTKQPEVVLLDKFSAAHYLERNGKPWQPWVALTFDNEDYDDLGINLHEEDYSVSVELEDMIESWDELSDDVKRILGTPNFRCGVFSNLLRKKGFDVHESAEDEQAATILVMLLFQEHYGEGWKDKMNDFMLKPQEDSETSKDNTDN
jgi:hypothetical protein